MSGPLPAELGNLANLTALTLAGNRLSGCVPEIWRNVETHDLDELGLPSCAAAAQPAASGERAALETLYNAADGANWRNNDNWLSAAPLDDWHGVTTDDSGRVVELDLRENGLRGAIPAKLGDLVHLQYLLLADNELSGPLPAELGNLVNLTALVIANNGLSGPLPAELGNLTNLIALVIADNELSGPLPAELGNLANLQYLLLAGNRLNGPLPAELGNLANLTRLYLAGNP